jgi:hypothetical protein
LYCEPRAIAPEPEPDALVGGLRGRLKRCFEDVLAAAEQVRTNRATSTNPQATPGLLARLKAWGLSGIANAIAAQRLLWALRHAQTATLIYPADLTQSDADDRARRVLQRDADRHRWWLGIDTLLLALSLLLILLPGPNLVGYYFAFRVVGHYLSWRGARHGLDTLDWRCTPSEPLADLRAAIDMAPVQRALKLHELANRLCLADLPSFVERLAFRSA